MRCFFNGVTNRQGCRRSSRYSKDAFQRTKARYLAVWLNEHIPKDLSLAAWGAGKVAKKQASHLAKEGVRIERFFEVDPRKIGSPRPGLEVSSIADIPATGQIFLLVLAGARSAREKITRFLEDRNYKCGKNYLFVCLKSAKTGFQLAIGSDDPNSEISNLKLHQSTTP